MTEKQARTTFDNFALNKDGEIGKDNNVNFGSQDLIRMAEYLSKNNYAILSFKAADSELDPLSEKSSENISEEMIYILKTYGSNELQAAMQDDFEGLYVVELTVKNNLSERAYIIGRSQIIETKIDENTNSSTPAETDLAGGIYDMELFQLEDHDLVRQVYAMSDEEFLNIELADKNGEVWLEENGDKAVIQLTKNEIEDVLLIAQKDSSTVNEAFLKVIRAGMGSDGNELDD